MNVKFMSHRKKILRNIILINLQENKKIVKEPAENPFKE